MSMTNTHQNSSASVLVSELYFNALKDCFGNSKSKSENFSSSFTPGFSSSSPPPPACSFEIIAFSSIFEILDLISIPEFEDFWRAVIKVLSLFPSIASKTQSNVAPLSLSASDNPMSRLTALAWRSVARSLSKQKRHPEALSAWRSALAGALDAFGSISLEAAFCYESLSECLLVFHAFEGGVEKPSEERQGGGGGGGGGGG
eukprot:CAMPEP_0175077244 /NCGR_PEP_ID=MMETSP0052_2-20121109/23266_1 /TAXON_ID=51329 ORGANISM="Polytomella parva, Strain SAG 63-3" /NCGR_SAMPLE_ID=MMETSP0052_2 /ASSEMBLY_ACC=CAM_ASM_000194 /LENGTH=201 /DNA_ID=CAMNT_0016346655 /DNA_START=194 /DNA_END=795 /DNA_ORIENTATION=+